MTPISFKIIDEVDETILNILAIEGLEVNFSFDIPDRDFFSQSGDAVNIYLYDIHEDRDLRTLESIYERDMTGGVVKKKVPMRIKLSYCITVRVKTLSEGNDGKGEENSRKEHAYLSRLLVALVKYPTIPEYLLAGDLENQTPPMPTTIVLPDKLSNPAQFWSALGSPIRPCIIYSVTFSLDYSENEPPAPILTSMATKFGDKAASDHRMKQQTILIAGQVVQDADPQLSIANAWILLERGNERKIEVTKTDGRFTFSGLTTTQQDPKAYQLRARAPGFLESIPITIDPADPKPDTPESNYRIIKLKKL